MQSSAVILGFGAQASVGLSTPAISAAVAGSLNNFRFEKRIHSGKTGAPIVSAWLETLAEDWFALDRMKALSRAAAVEALESLPPQMRQGPDALRLPVLIALPGPRPGFDNAAALQLVQSVLRSLPITLDERCCSMLLGGHAGGIKLLSFAERILAEYQAPAVLVGGIESYRDLSVLRYIEASDRLRTEDEPLGWIPGEGAGFLLLASREGAARLDLPAPIGITATAASLEPRPWYSGQATVGEGLTDTLQEVFAAPGVPVETYCDLNGEPWRVDEWGFAYLRTAGNYVAPLAMRHPADCWGDVGAASGPLLMALAAQNMLSGIAASDRALVWTASDASPLRSACVLQKL